MFRATDCLTSIAAASEPKGSSSRSAEKIFDELSQLVETHRPSQVAMEEVFVGRNAASALKLGQARGAAMAACLQSELEVSEYSARQVKQAVVGTGAAQKGKFSIWLRPC